MAKKYTVSYVSGGDIHYADDDYEDLGQLYDQSAKTWLKDNKVV
jgi:hypothetical protein